ncbi:cold-regulated 413 plasma membrane protein 4-like [Chenopodium quinoa]|uniref:cold-regulated 413 plasma membrane protein 4-like n=1 Tax=Chenopodium quinoa TaxID=63459 RepID=UPI000B775F8D|nr:cold-regulated 413 plasma membrane protein 4-like [Chenopodium quinoa]
MKTEMLETFYTVIAGDFASENGNAAIRSAFCWAASFSALFLLVLNLLGRRSRLQASFLALFLTASLPEAVFQILRGQFGCWVAIFAIAANYCFPDVFPVSVSRFLFFVVMPNWLAYELRESIAGCLVSSLCEMNDVDLADLNTGCYYVSVEIILCVAVIFFLSFFVLL